MIKSRILKGIPFLLLIAFAAAFLASPAKADNASGVSYRSVTIENVDIFRSQYNVTPIRRTDVHR